ncbi:MAG: 4Fe-4S cluster-binding domain-containing protein [Bacteroidales bacterium]
MYKRTVLNFNHSQLLEAFTTAFPLLVNRARESRTALLFKEEVKKLLLAHNHAEPLMQLLENDGKAVNELSTGEQLKIKTITHLWHFLNGKPVKAPIHTDLLIDLYHQFKLLEAHNPNIAEPNNLPTSPQTTLDYPHLKRMMHRWPSGMDKNVQTIRIINQERMIPLLISKIERKHSPLSKFHFPERAVYQEKYKTVQQWWELSKFHLAMAVKDPVELNAFLGNSLSQQTMELLTKAKEKGMPFFITPYYLSLLNIGKEGYDDAAIRSYILYSPELVQTYGSIKAWEKEDIVMEGVPNAAGWLVPGHNIHRRYQRVAILIPDSMGRACGGLCASCQRMYDFQSKRLNFDFESLKPKESWDKKLSRLMDYFEQDTQLRDILITGGDAFMSQNATLRKILDAVYKMALRKRKANRMRSDGEKFAELQRVRLGSRLLAYLPLRIDTELIDILKDFKEKATTAGITQFVIQTHFQTPLEVTPQAVCAINAIISAGWVITNQLVYNVAASRRGHTARLRQVLNSVGVICYYTFSVKGFQENYAVFTPNSRSLQEQHEEKIFGTIPPQKTEELIEMIRSRKSLVKRMGTFMKENHLPFLATDRNVLNLPAIGKSMTFQTVGITGEGKRILKFEHDAGRVHSPIIDRMGEVYIVENKSIASYLRQLKEMGEELKEYESIWGYTAGVTEPRFPLYDYREYPFNVTPQITNLQI